eukprot:11765345-Alexandrium_andersonii.AAC.1
MLGDSSAEGPQAYVSRTVQVRTAARPSTWSYFLRAKQNTATMLRLGSVEPGAFAKLFAAWKAIAQTHAAKAA